MYWDITFANAKAIFLISRLTETYDVLRHCYNECIKLLATCLTETYDVLRQKSNR